MRFAWLFETASDWFWETDASGRFTFVSSNVEALYGLSVGELVGRRLNDLPNAKIDPEMAQKALAAIKTRQPFRDFVYSHDLANGRVIWVKVSAIPLSDTAGAFCGYWGVSKDITAEVEADHALRESEHRFRQLFEIAADYYFEQDEYYRYSYVSPNYEIIFGIQLSDVIGKRLSDTPDVSIEPEMGRMAILAHKAKQPYRDFVYSRKFADGRKRWFKVSGAPVFDRNGVFKGYRGVGAEITPHVEAEAAARLAQQRLHEAVTHVTQPIVVYDAQDRVVTYNQAFTDLHKARDTNTPVGRACPSASWPNGSCASAFMPRARTMPPSISRRCLPAIRPRRSTPITCTTAAGCSSSTAACLARAGSDCGRM
jgi:PAS domain S-box-containing protein